MQTLKAFLDSIQLQQYHPAFLKAGATDQDLQQFIEFTDQELNELLVVLDMLPFHTIKFKKSLRELKCTQDVIPETDLVNVSIKNPKFFLCYLFPFNIKIGTTFYPPIYCITRHYLW